jgi:DNA polymerase
MQGITGLDFETYSAVDLPTYGMDRYMDDKSFTPLLASCYMEDNSGVHFKTRFDFVKDFDAAKTGLFDLINGRTICGQNVAFEERTLEWLYPGSFTPEEFIDSAVVARVAGAGSSLEHAARQLLDSSKMEEGRNLIKLFSCAGPYQEANDSPLFDPLVVAHNPKEWQTYQDYCDVDAELSFRLVKNWSFLLGDNEQEYDVLTRKMNQVGWRVDLDKVHEMQRRFEENKVQAVEEFYADVTPNVDVDKRLNFNSFPQMKEFCAARGVKARSFDSDHVDSLLDRITDRLRTNTKLTPEQVSNLHDVREFLRTKQVLGGSSLSKLQKIIDLTGNDGQLRNSYMHVGAGATLRTTGRGVQMQNLKRLTEPADMSELDDATVEWSNDELAVNLRQVFTARHPDGVLIVGDFSSVESRGLGYIAGAEWKMEAYHQGKDLYKVLAQEMFSVSYDAVTKPQRQTGKVGELSCGYGAGPGAVKDFAAKMGVEFTEGEAAQLVSDWRATNPEVVRLWDLLDKTLREVVEGGNRNYHQLLGNDLVVCFEEISTPSSLRLLNPHAKSIRMTLRHNSRPQGELLLSRVFHGCYVRGRDIGYYKPAKNKGGDPWINCYKHPKTGQVVFYKLYGGKLSGILTQSLCRELFFYSLRELQKVIDRYSNVKIVGQFHDEIVVDWQPGYAIAPSIGLDLLEQEMSKCMSTTVLPGFPLAADIKSAYRYIK